MNDIIKRIKDFADGHLLIGRGDRILLSLSAGKDSMFLLDVMMKLAEAYDIGIGIFHLNHMLRGPEADRDELHIAGLCERLGLELHVRRHDFSGTGRRGASVEEAARDMRYRMLESIAASNAYAKIATAHNRDDTVETIVMRMFTGTGIHGLTGIPARRGMVIRPVLCVAADEIYEYLRMNSIEWREDLSNRGNAYSRNFVRNTVIPAAEERFPMAKNAIHSLGEVSAETVALLNALIAEQYPSLVEYSGDTAYIDASRIAHSRALFFHSISSVVRDHFGRYVDRTMLQIIFDGYGGVHANRRLYENKFLRIEKARVGTASGIRISPAASRNTRFSDWEYRIDLTDGREREIEIPEAGLSLRVAVSDYRHFLNDGKNTRAVFVTLKDDMTSLYIRNRRNGDRIATEAGTKKIKDLLIEKKLDHYAKNRVPILTDGSKILAFMPGLLFDTTSRISRDFLVDKKSEKVLAVFTKPNLE